MRNALDRQPGTPASAMFFDSVNGVFGTTRMETAIMAEERANRQPVAAHHENQKVFHGISSKNKRSTSVRSALRSGT